MNKFLKFGGLFYMSKVYKSHLQSPTLRLETIPKNEILEQTTTFKDSYTLRTREEYIKDLESTDEFDILIIGGGATGVGTLLACSQKGLKAVLIESNDFASATSSKSTKLLHGGIRYLERVFKFRNKNRRLDYELVKEALAERNLMLNNAPYMTNQIAIIIPATNIFKGIYYYLGCKLYDFLCRNNKDTKYQL
jgi:glycerol-3-phosphate dehydrogenase